MPTTVSTSTLWYLSTGKMLFLWLQHTSLLVTDAPFRNVFYHQRRAMTLCTKSLRILALSVGYGDSRYQAVQAKRGTVARAICGRGMLFFSRLYF